uniref:Uncharacterized protein n=1 Tax=Leptobrachium leishanense TaxID=445787 RepID=A0A8C5LVG3_9ANUR
MVRSSTRRTPGRPISTPGGTPASPITAYFGSSRSRPAAQPPAKMAAVPAQMEPSSQGGQLAMQRLEMLIADLPTHAELPTRTDLKDMLDQIQLTFGQEITAVRADISAIDERVARLEETAAAHQICPHDQNTLADQRLSDMTRRIDDLENRSRRHNIRVRGVHEGVTELKDFLMGAFTQILGCPPLHHTVIDRAHRALRPRAVADSGPPRDIICHLPDFAIKEEIMLRARARRKWRFANENFELFQDLSPHTLFARSSLRPVTQLLREADIPYRWGFPFSLQVRRNNQLHTIRTPKDVDLFLSELHLPQIETVDWEHSPLMISPPTCQAGSPRPQRSPRDGRRSTAPHSATPDPAPI